MEEITYPHGGASEMFGEPEEDSGYEKNDGGYSHCPKPHFLSGIELAYVIGFGFIGFRGVVLDVPQPFTVSRLPSHLRSPAAELKENRDYKSDSEPRMQQPSARAASENWSQPCIKPGSEERESR